MPAYRNVDVGHRLPQYYQSRIGREMCSAKLEFLKGSQDISLLRLIIFKWSLLSATVIYIRTYSHPHILPNYQISYAERDELKHDQKFTCTV